MSGEGRKRILSGIQPSGELHLGNYFGAIRQQIALQDEGDAHYFIADYHSLTTLHDAERLRQLTREVAATMAEGTPLKGRRARVGA